MTPKQLHYEVLANRLISNLEKRNMSGYYCHTKSEALLKIESLLYDNATISWGGSMSLVELGLFPMLKSKNFNLLDRGLAKTPSEALEIQRKAFFSDFYFLSSNAITVDGVLYNVDGNGNRVAALIYGPLEVIVVIGINKICNNEKEALDRIRNVAAPINTHRLHKDTPCNKLGQCANCLVDDCICAHIVKTRYCQTKDRIKVIIVGDELGY